MSLAEELSSVYDEGSSEEVESQEVEAEADEVIDEVEPDIDLDVDDTVVEDELEESVDEPEEQQVQGIDPPAHWPAADREMFSKQTPEAQDWLMRRHREMESGLTQKTMEIADFRKSWEPVQSLFSQYPHVNPQETIAGWAQIAQALESNPGQTLQHLAGQYGVDLGNMEEQVQVDPQISSLRQELDQLKNQSIQRQQYEAQQAQSQRLTEIESFAQEQDEKGNLLRPLIDEAMPDMITMAQIVIQQGGNPSLPDLYDRAVYANPELRAKVLQQQQAQESAKRKQEAIAKAKKAKLQSKTIQGGAGNSSMSEVDDLRASLERQLS